MWTMTFWRDSPMTTVDCTTDLLETRTLLSNSRWLCFLCLFWSLFTWNHSASNIWCLKEDGWISSKNWVVSALLVFSPLSCTPPWWVQRSLVPEQVLGSNSSKFLNLSSPTTCHGNCSSLKVHRHWDFPGSPGLKILCFQWKEVKFNP